MKKVIAIAVLTAAMYSCNSKGNNDNASTDSTVNTPGVQNVNGNIPDTTNSISIEQHSKDTTTKH